MRGVMGEPDRLEFSNIRETGLTAIFTYGTTQCILAWVDLPGIARYEMELALYSPDRRLTLSFPSPFLRSMPTVLISETGEAKSPRSSRTKEITSFNESFKEELIHFHDCVTSGREPVTSGRDTLRDIALCEAIVGAHRAGAPRERPSEPVLTAAR
jgi:predicted dehydrogenase